MSVMIGIDPHKALHALCAIDDRESELGEVVDTNRGSVAACLRGCGVELCQFGVGGGRMGNHHAANRKS